VELGFCNTPHSSIAVTVYLGWFIIMNLPGIHLYKKLFSGVKNLEVFNARGSLVASSIGHDVAKDFPANDDPVLFRSGLPGWV
jgi:hypothetical protein